MARKTFDYKDFSGGDWGRLDRWRAPKNTFSGTNMLVYRTGELGVRAGVRLTNPTGIANGPLWGIGQRPLNGGDVWYGQGTAIKTFNPSALGAVGTATGVLTGTPSARVAMDETGATTYIATTTENGYSYNGTAITNLTNMPDAQAIAIYGSRLAVVPLSANNTVQFSADSSFNNWTVSPDNAVSITVGDTDSIWALFSQRNHLVVMKQLTSLYVVTGTPGTNEALRQVARANGPARQFSAARANGSGDEIIWYAPLDSQTPAAFTGSQLTMLDNYPLPLYPGLATRSVVTFPADDDAGVAFIVQGDQSSLDFDNEVWVRYRGVWTKHSFGVAVSDYVAPVFLGFPQDGDATLSRIRYGTCLVFSDGGDAGVTPNFWSWMPFMDRPGLEVEPLGTGSMERAGDASATPVEGSATLAVQRADDGTDVQVTGVIVDFRSWNTGGDENNHFDLVVNTLNSYESSAPVSSATASFDEAPTSSSLAGDVRSKYFGVGDQGRGGAFNLELTNVRGVAFQRFRIVTETYPARIG